MYSLKLEYAKNGGPNNVYAVLYAGTRRFSLEEWGFHSCAVNNLFSFAYSYNFFTPKRVDELIEFLKVYKSPANPQAPYYYAKESLFCITDAQKVYLEPLIAHPNVKLVDRFVNKAHGPETMNLFRLSSTKDFLTPLV